MLVAVTSWKDFATWTGKSTFSEHILNAGHETRPIEEIVTILHCKIDPEGINVLEEMEIMKVTASDDKFNINPLYKMLNHFWTRQRPAQINAEDARGMVKGLHV